MLFRSQALEDDAVAIQAGDAQLALGKAEQTAQPPPVDHLPEQGKGGVPVGCRHSPGRQHIAQGAFQQPHHQPLGRKHRLPAARSPIQHHIPVAVLSQKGQVHRVKGPGGNIDPQGVPSSPGSSTSTRISSGGGWAAFSA